MLMSVRSTLSAGVAAGLVAVAGATVVSPVKERPLTAVSSPAVQLSAAIAPLLQPIAPAAASGTPSPAASVTANLGTGTTSAGDAIINIYNIVEPWVAYGVSLAEWATAWLPWPIGLIAPQIDLLYNAWQPVGQGLAYAAAFLLDGQFDLVLPTLFNGVKTGVGNLVRGEINWVLSFFPPLPPLQFPVRPSATALTARTAAVTARSAATEAVTGAEAPAESAAPQTMPTRADRQAARTAARAARSVRAAAATASGVVASDAAEAPAPKARKVVRAAAAKAVKVAGAAGSARANRAER